MTTLVSGTSGFTEDSSEPRAAISGQRFVWIAEGVS
ncbi:MAG: hypothetical protein JWM01_2853 [Arthrobacter sp.]|jgi:hypothetical protein|nr:hypothetical protein [Arthrobacter sp.]